jgi:uncharacterized protein (TIGR03000 family)
MDSYLDGGIEGQPSSQPGSAAPGSDAPGSDAPGTGTGTDPQTRSSRPRDEFDLASIRRGPVTIRDVQDRVRTVTSGRTGTAVLTLNVPEDAVVYVNDQRMKTQGSERRFVAKNLSFQRKNTYEIRVVTMEQGVEVAQTKVIDLVPELPSLLAFDFNREVAPVTSVTLRVPAEAKVRLAGVDTQSGGELRYFYTNSLAVGQVWDDYEIEVQWEEAGETVVKRQTVQLAAGKPLHLNFESETAVLVATK